MSTYEFDGPDFVKVVVAALGAEAAARIEADYRSGDPADAAVARFVDRLLCEAQEAIGDAEIRWGGDYWADALDAEE